MNVGHSLRFHALGRIYHQDSAFTRRQAPGDLVREVHMNGCIQKIQSIALPIFSLILHRHGMGLDGDSAFTFEIHRIEQLILLIPFFDRAGGLQQTIRESSLPVIDMSNYTEIAGETPWHPRAALFFSPQHASPGQTPGTAVAWAEESKVSRAARERTRGDGNNSMHN